MRAVGVVTLDAATLPGDLAGWRRGIRAEARRHGIRVSIRRYGRALHVEDPDRAGHPDAIAARHAQMRSAIYVIRAIETVRAAGPAPARGPRRRLRIVPGPPEPGA